LLVVDLEQDLVVEVVRDNILPDQQLSRQVILLQFKLVLAELLRNQVNILVMTEPLHILELQSLPVVEVVEQTIMLMEDQELPEQQELDLVVVLVEIKQVLHLQVEQVLLLEQILVVQTLDL
jgi:hypothetical protein